MPLYPGNADYNDGRITVDAALNSPEVIEQRIASIADEKSLLNDIFTEGTAPEGGAVIYARATRDNLFPDGDVSPRLPGDEYNVVQPRRPEDRLAKVEDFGAKVAVTDEARRRNRAVDFDNAVTQLANTVIRKINRRAAETVAAVIAEGGDDLHQVQASAQWSELLAHGPEASLSNPRELPGANFATLAAKAEEDQLGIEYKTLLVSPAAKSELRNIYGPKLGDLLTDLGLTMKTSVDIPAAHAYLIDPGKFGFVSFEDHLTVETWRDEHHRQTWIQTHAGPVMGATMPGALAVVNGIV